MGIKKIILISISIILCVPVVYFSRIAASQEILKTPPAPTPPGSEYNWNRQQYTPLMNAARLGLIDEVRDLIASGAPLDEQSQDVDQSTESSNKFFDRGSSDPSDYLYNTALHIAIYNAAFVSNYSIAHMLINAGANVRIANGAGDTPMHFIMQRILRQGNFDLSNLNMRDNSGIGTTPANSIPGLSEREDLLINLILHGADVNAQNSQGYTILHIGVLDNEGQWVQTLTEKYGSIVDFSVKAFKTSCKSPTALEGAPLTNASNSDCKCLTPIQLAGDWAGTCTGNTNIRDYFLNNKPKILGATERDVMGMTGFMLAVIWEGTQKLKNPQYDPAQDAHRDFTVDKLMKEADLNATINCLKAPCDPDRDLHNTVLHIAILHQLPDMVKKIVEGAKNLGKKIDVNIKNVKGDAPLHYVVTLNAVNLKAGNDRDTFNKNSRNNVVHYLMEHGGNINIQNNNGDTLLHLAVKANAVDLVKFILTAYNVKGLNANQLVNLSLTNNDGLGQGNPRGKTALDLAQDLEFTDIAQLLAGAMKENQKLLDKLNTSEKKESQENAYQEDNPTTETALSPQSLSPAREDKGLTPS